MAITRSKRTTSEVVTETKVVESPVKRKKLLVTTTTKVTTSKLAKAPKIHIEDALRQRNPDIYTGILPEEFVNSHNAEFIEGCHHVLKQDPTLYAVTVHAPFPNYKPGEPKATVNDYWYSLIRLVMGQQVSGAAAKLVAAKFRALFPKEEGPTPQGTLKFTFDELKASGLSNQKTKYVISISEAFSDSNHPLSKIEFYQNASADELTAELIKLKGIAEWLAKMFEAFTLRRLRVFAYEDLGVARGMARYLEKRPEILNEVKQIVNDDEEKRARLKKKLKFTNGSNSKRDWVPLHDEYVCEVARKFAPYETVFMMILWRLLLTNVDVLLY